MTWRIMPIRLVCLSVCLSVCLLHVAMWGFHDRQLTIRSLLYNQLTGGQWTDALRRRWRHHVNAANQQVRARVVTLYHLLSLQCMKHRVLVFKLPRAILRFFAAQERYVALILGELWHGDSSVPNFTIVHAGMWVWDPKNWKFYQILDYKRPASAYLLCNFDKICIICRAFREGSSFKI